MRADPGADVDDAESALDAEDVRRELAGRDRSADRPLAEFATIASRLFAIAAQ